jgi:hypothetical protein
MRRLFPALVLQLALTHAALAADQVPDRAKQYLPALVTAQQNTWPDAPTPSFLAGQIEQESCVTLRSQKCWNPRAELKTSRENGVGMGQFTRAYRADGSIRFDTISALAAKHESLRGWSWASRYDASYQLLAIVVMDKDLYDRQRDAATVADRLSFTLSAYNGGQAGVLQDRRLCANTDGCDPSRWFDNVEQTSLKSRKAQRGYGQSFFKINREYVANILKVRRFKYEPYFKGSPDAN